MCAWFAARPRAPVSSHLGSSLLPRLFVSSRHVAAAAHAAMKKAAMKKCKPLRSHTTEKKAAMTKSTSKKNAKRVTMEQMARQLSQIQLCTNEMAKQLSEVQCDVLLLTAILRSLLPQVEATKSKDVYSASSCQNEFARKREDT